VSTPRKHDDFLGQQFGDYHLKEIIAVGGMARVYLGEDLNLGREAAVKVLDLRQDWVDENIIGRFEREARAVAPLEHPNIITIWAYGTEKDAYFQAMQYIPGADLRKVLKEYRERGVTMPIDRTLYIARQVASALDYAHQRGIIHRDVKPSNVLLREDDTAVLTDFGLVLRNDDNTMGTAFGTPRYIAPEQAVASSQAVPQSDIYAFAVIVYEMLTGDTPFDGDTPMEIALAHVSDPPERPSKRNGNIPTDVDDVLMRALEKEPEDRYPSATDFVLDIAAGYGITLAPIGFDTAPTHPPVTKKDRPAPEAKKPAKPEPKADEPEPEPAASAAASAPTGATQEPSSGGLSAAVVIGGGIAALVIIIAAASLLFGGGNGRGNNGVVPVGDEETAEVVLTYNGESFTIYNGGDYALTDLGRLSFVRGAPDEGGDDYAGSRVPGQELEPGACHYVQLQGAPRTLPDDCDAVGASELLSNTNLFHWRSDDQSIATFDVLWGEAVLTRCDTVRRGESNSCTFLYPLPPS